MVNNGAVINQVLIADKSCYVRKGLRAGYAKLQRQNRQDCASGEMLWVIHEGRLPRFSVRLSTCLY